MSVCLSVSVSQVFNFLSLLTALSLSLLLSLSLFILLVTNMSKRPAFLTVFTAAYTLYMHTIIAVYNLQS